MAQCAYKDCSKDAWQNCPKGFCIYHSPDNGKDKDAAGQVWTEARKRAQDPRGCDFTGWHFPDDPEKKWFIDATFQAPARFNEASFHGLPRLRGAISPGYSWFHQAIFQGRAIFNWATFHSDAGFFNGAIFQHEASFHQATFEGLATFNGGAFCSNAFLDMADFQDNVMFLGVEFQGEAHFAGATIRGNAFFGRATFKRDAFFNQTAFHSDALFDKTTFRSMAYFARAAFHGPTSFSGATFASKVSFMYVFVKDGTNIVVDLPTWELPFHKANPFQKREQGQELYRLAKESARRQADYLMAGNYHFAERCAAEYGNRKKHSWKLWRCGFWTSYLEWLFARMVFGYGERVLRPLFAGLVVILMWAVLYSAMGGVSPGGLAREAAAQSGIGFWECLYFSLITFTTLGYGDMVPNAHLFFRLLAGIQAWLGAALMALFVVALTRKYMR